MKEQDTEIWKPITGYAGLYSVSNKGRVVSHRKGIIMKPSLSGGGYRQVSLWNSGACRTYGVHRLVATEFVENPYKNNEVNHRDGIKTNNFASNLDWVTHWENMRHATINGLQKSRSGSNHFRAKLRNEDIPLILEMSAKGEEQKAIGRHFNVSPETICRIVSGKAWKYAQR